MKAKYSDCVFINCPFDSEYADMFRASIFTVLDAGFIPRCSLEVANGAPRLNAIVALLKGCKYGVHDLSRVQLDSETGLPRFNMPFELGLFYAARHFGTAEQTRKLCLVFEEDRYRYQKFISDIAGVDVTPHGGSPENVIAGLRDWLVTASHRTTIPAGAAIKSRFLAFTSDMEQVCNEHFTDYYSMPFVELVYNMTDWLDQNQTRHSPLFPL